MAKAPLIRDVFVKFDRYYKDLYIINHSCFCGGKETERSTKGFFFGVMNDLGSKLLKDNFKDGKVLFVDDVTKAKDDLENHVDILNTESAIDKIKDQFARLFDKVKEEDEWLPLPLTDEELEKLITDAEAVDFTFDESMKPITITKTVFPSITIKNISSVQYIWNYGEESGLVELTFRYPAEYFTLFMIYYFLPDDD